MEFRVTAQDWGRVVRYVLALLPRSCESKLRIWMEAGQVRYCCTFMKPSLQTTASKLFLQDYPECRWAVELQGGRNDYLKLLIY